MPANLFSDWHFDLGPIALFGVLLFAGLLGGELARRLHLPQLLGYLAAGIVCGPFAADLPAAAFFGEARSFFDLGVSLILFELGRRLDLRGFLRDRALVAAALLEAGLGFALMSAALWLAGFSLPEAATGAAVGVSTAPEVVWLVARELRAEGEVSERCLNLAALNTMLALVAVAALIPTLRSADNAEVTTLIVQPLYLFLVSVALGVVASRVTLSLLRRFGRRPETQLALVAAMILLAIGIARELGLALLLAMLVFGIDLRTYDRYRLLAKIDFGSFAEVFYIVMFVVAGANLELAALPAVGLPALGYLAARTLGKAGGVLLAAPLATDRSGGANALLAATLLPMSGVTLALLHDLTTLFADFGSRLTTAVIAAVVILELLGPLAVYWALRRAGEAAPASGESAAGEPG